MIEIMQQVAERLALREGIESAAIEYPGFISLDPTETTDPEIGNVTIQIGTVNGTWGAQLIEVATGEILGSFETAIPAASDDIDAIVENLFDQFTDREWIEIEPVTDNERSYGPRR